MDEQAITNLIYRCASLQDQGEWGAAAELFANAQVALSAGGQPLDAGQLIALWRSEATGLTQAGGRQRLITNPVVAVDQTTRTAKCRSCYTLLEQAGSAPPHMLATGVYEDEFEYVAGQWRFSRRQRLPLAEAKRVTDEQAAAPTLDVTEDMSPTKRRILAAAQQVFSTVGYSEAGIRRIAELVGLSPTILFRHFGTKAALFEAAMIDAIVKPRAPVERTKFGEHIASLLSDPYLENCPHAMTVLATGNEESREIAIRVLEQYAIGPMVEWLGAPNSISRAREIMALCAGFALYHSQLNATQPRQVDSHMVKWLARSIQAVVDGAE
ncbi:nuclear transport factor 2 family protein [Halioxenophilus sp. WMMB6]|uniref:nuclear transport factor 2 family protein n=1 Tax=Halioxenophilus sp. WMMB6 TaxID=3073815 RepID=UPI00295EE47C|nr:nuclear transport factor 2 family protein [Halioxenophilus sp. WMMB6]